MNADSYKYIRFNTSQETRWATIDEIKRSCAHIDLTAEDYPAAGIPIISDGKEAYVDNLDTHSLIFGATGSKKTRLFCMPMINIMAKAGESFIVTDPKGELYAQTSGLVKRKGYKTVVLNFRNIGTGDMWNPLSLPYELWKSGNHEEAGLLLSDIVSTIAGPISKNNKDAYWSESAQELAIAGLYVLMEAAEKNEVNMKSFAHISSHGNVDNIKTLVEEMREDTVAALNYRSTACLSANVTVAGIVGVLFGMLRMFTVNEKLSRMLSDNTFNMRMFGREKTAVYIIVPDEKTTYHFLVTMFIKQAYEILIEEAQKEKNRQLPVRVNFVLDEFCNIPMIPDMPSMISAARSRNMRYFLVVQSMHQLKGRYGEDADTIKGNCDNWVFLTSKELDLLNEISELCGSVILPDGQVRRLISPSELQRFDKAKGEALIMHARQYPTISEMADISQYEMFGIYEPEPIKEVELEEIGCFSFRKLLQDIENLEALAPFPSEDHLLSQAKKIYRQEYDRQKIEDDDDDVRPYGRRHLPFRFRSNLFDDDDEAENGEEEEKPAEPEETEEERLEKEKKKAEKEKERKEKIKIAEEKARVRIAKLISEEYAERFFAERLMDRDSSRSSFDDLY